MRSDLDPRESLSPTEESPPLPPPPPPRETTIKDIVRWKRRRFNIAAILISTAAWVALEIYGLNFVTVLSWAAMLGVTCLFIWGNIDGLLRKESSRDMPWLHISRESAVATANLFHHRVEQCVNSVLRFGAESSWHVVTGALASLALLSRIATHLHFVSFLYLGVLGGLTVPITYIKYEHKIKESEERVRVHYRRCYSMVWQKANDLKNLISSRAEYWQKKVFQHKKVE
ncbi:unnamed protein product [Cuscuta europaea]|uniref:Reticulon-like protein n=1 Tax=Cuscuta europaea TaxID=41803 RepID=A0A9P0YNF9_CUSEU|nr:unnamed protein product [Cuscuta europaea]